MAGSDLPVKSKQRHSQQKPDLLAEWLAPVVAFIVLAGIVLALVGFLTAEP